MNFLAYGYLAGGIFCLMLTTFVMDRHEKSAVRDSFLMLVYVGAIWQWGSCLVMKAPNVYWATIFSRLAYLGCIFIPIVSYQFIVNFCSLQSQVKFVKFGYWFGVIVFFPLLFTDLLLTNTYSYPWGYWFHAGKFHPLFLVFFGIFGMAGFINLIVQQSKITDQVERGKCLFLLWANFVLFLGIIDFLPDYGLRVFPLGFLFTSLWIFSIWIVIKHYDFFSMWRKFLQ